MLTRSVLLLILKEERLRLDCYPKLKYHVLLAIPRQFSNRMLHTTATNMMTCSLKTL
jgi:hypothetical protein